MLADGVQARPDALESGILGDLVASRSGTAVDLGGRQQRAVLALLVLARGDVLPAERLVDALWSGSPPASATSTLHSHVSRLRSRLAGSRETRGAGPGILVRQGPGYRLDLPRDAVDAWRFERLLSESTGGSPDERADRLTAALTLWRGPALADYVGEPWAEAEATRLDGLREVARDQLLAARLDRGEHAVLVPELERLVAEDALREERWRLLALALYRSSRQADALAALRRARDVLADELGVDPGPALRRLEADVLAQSPALDLLVPPSAGGSARPAPLVPSQASARGAAVGTAPDMAPDTGGRAERTPPARPPDAIVGRGPELAQLRRALDDGCAGVGGLVVLEGPAGIGKTRLLTEARRMAAEEGFQILSARGSQLEHEYGFGAVRQLFEPVLADPARREALLSGAAAPARGVFDLAAGPVTADAFGVLNGLFRLTLVLAGDTPLLLTVDDLQWCDTGSLRYLAFLQRRLESVPVVVVATLRTGQAYVDDELLTEIVGDAGTLAVRPGPLTDTDVAELVRARLGADAAPRFVEACFRTTGGNPLLLRQLLRALEAEQVPPDAVHADTVTAIGSRAVSSMVLLRLRRLPPSTTEVARAVAVLGDGAELAGVVALARLPEPDVVAAIATLSRAEVLRPDYPIGFVHPVVADAVYRDLAPGERETAHERAARILDDSGASPEQVAAHLLLAPRRADGWAVDVLVRAADRAESRGAPEAARAFVARAVEEPPPPSVRVRLLVRLSLLAGQSDGPAAQRALEAAYDQADDAAQRAEVALVLTGALVFLGRSGDATAFALRAVDALPAELVDERQALVAMARTAGWIHLLPPDRWLGAEPLDIVGDGVGARMLAVEQAWELCVRGVDRARALELVRWALGHEEWVAGSHDLFHDVAGIVLMVADEDTTSYWQAALDRAHARGEVITVGMHLWQGVALWRTGRLREAQQSLQVARHQTEEWGSDEVGVPYCDAFRVLVTLDTGDVTAARDLLDEALDRRGIGDGRRLLLEAEAAVLLAEHRSAEALAALDRLTPEQAGLANPSWYTARALRAQALLALSRHDEAVRVLEAEVATARRWGAVGSLGRLLRQLAVARSGVEGEAEAREAVALLDGHPARLQLARALAALAALVADDDERVDLLHRAVVLADECGAERLRREVAEALADLGAAAPGPLDPRDTLTALERRSTELAGVGVDSGEIARRLYVTPRSVDAALASVRRRLGVATDAEAAVALASRRS
ncbi:MAG TPA: BTAD domain-containing putative transcriptional regulator [Jiangellales bacterium]|nr:BTAD domain-containing putative transcriptional regulator [Jiangellales bacterium]